MRLESREFLELVQTLPQLTYVFVALGSDTRNIEAAVRLRELCQRRGLHPYILAVVQDPFKTVALTSVTDYRGTAGVGLIQETHTTFIFWAHGICCTPRATSSTPGWKRRR